MKKKLIKVRASPTSPVVDASHQSTGVAGEQVPREQVGIPALKKKRKNKRKEVAPMGRTYRLKKNNPPLATSRKLREKAAKMRAEREAGQPTNRTPGTVTTAWL